MSANDNKIVPSDQSRSPASEDHDTRVATRAYAVRHGDTTLEHLSSERGLDYDEVLRLNPAVSARNGLLKAGDVLKLPKQGASGPKRADGVDGAAQPPGPSTAPSSADDANAPAVVDARIVGEADPAGDAPRGDSQDDGADDTGDPVPPGSRRTSREDDASSSASASEGTTATTAESSSPSPPPPPSSSPTDDASSRPESLDDVHEDMRRRGVSAVRGFGGVVGALVKTAGATAGGFREAAAASSAALRESSEDLRRTSVWVDEEMTGIAAKAGEEIENHPRRRRDAVRGGDPRKKERDDAAAGGGDPASEPGIAEAPAEGSTPPPPTPPAGSPVHETRQDEGTAPGREDEKRKRNEGNPAEEAAKARLAEAAAKRRAEAMARQAAREAERAAREAERAARRKERDRLRDARDEQRRAAAASAEPAAAKPTAPKPTAPKPTAPKPTAPKPTRQSEDKVQADLKAKVEADRAKVEREREARRRDFEARRKAREERRKEERRVEKKGDASKVKPAESKPAFELPFQAKKPSAKPKPEARRAEPAARIRALADRVRERPEETARVAASAAAGVAAGAIAGGLTRVGFVGFVAATTRRAFENGLLATAGGIFWDGAGITVATRAKGELARVRAGGPDAAEPTFAESRRDAMDARRLDLPARVGPALNFGRFLPGGGVVACLKLVLFGIAEERRAADPAGGASSADPAGGGTSSADPAGAPGGPDDDVAAIAALAAAEAAVAAAEAAAASTPETTPAKDSTHAVVPKLSPVPPGSPTTPAAKKSTNAAEPSSTPGTPPPRSAYPAKTPGKTRGGADDDDETDPLTPRTLGAVGMSGAASPPPAAPAAPALSPRRPLPRENATRDEYRVAELKLEGRRDALAQRYVATEAAEGRTVDPTVIAPPSPAAPSRRWLMKTSPSASPSRGGGVRGVPALDLARLNGNAEDESLTERRARGDRDAASDKAASDAGVAKKFEDERAGDAELRWRVERLDRECAILEGRLAFREDEKTRELMAMREKETADAARRVKKSIWHFATSLKRRALLAWVLELDEATRRKRLLRKALARMRMRTLSDSFEGWLEFRRKAKEQRLERKVAELERRAAAAEAAEVAAQRDRDDARREAEDKAAALAEAEAREAEARHEVATIRGEDAEPWSPASAATATPLGATTPASP